MIRKILFAVAATVAVGAATLSVSTAPASAWGYKHHHRHFHGHWGGGYRFHAPLRVVSYNGCYRKRLVGTPYGLRWRLVNVCY
jgi:hypothetical protein